MKFLFNSLLVILILLITLFVTNPNATDLKKKIDSQKGLFESVLDDIIADDKIISQDYYLFSIYCIETKSAFKGDKESYYIGILTTFKQIDRKTYENLSCIIHKKMINGLKF